MQQRKTSKGGGGIDTPGWLEKTPEGCEFRELLICMHTGRGAEDASMSMDREQCRAGSETTDEKAASGSNVPLYLEVKCTPVRRYAV